MNNVNVIIRLCGIAATILTLLLPVAGQDRYSDGEKEKDEFLKKKENLPVTLPMSEAVAMESIVNPDYYVVGPGDVITVTIWMSPPVSLPLTVTPEGTLIIPTVAEVNIGNNTLSDAKRALVAAVRKKYIVSDISATLTKPRQVSVTVLGQVVHPGPFTRHASDRVSGLIDAANEAVTKDEIKSVGKTTEAMSRRRIVVQHRDGTSQRVDLAAYVATKSDSCNPYLREGDVVIVPRREKLTGAIALYGEVNTPGRIEHIPGDTFLGAIRLAQGLTARALPESVLFSRQGLNGEVLTNTVLSVTSMMNGMKADIELQPGDRIIVPLKVENRGDYNVDIRGEVVRPGTYPITKGSTKLSEIISQAGGLTAEASVSAAHVLRHLYVQDPDRGEEIADLRGSMFAEDSLGFTIESGLRSEGELVSVNVERLLSGDGSQDILLQPEDEIVIPSLRRSVYVFGQVMTPGHVEYVRGEGIRFYVNRAGGYTENARSGDVKIIKAGTKQWLSPGDTEVEDGDYIWVPQDQQRPFAYYLNVASQAAGVIGVLLGVTALIIQLSK
jgi:protein involved in polysaccharide export with SLBB domain